MMTYKLGGESIDYTVIRALVIISCLYLQNFRELAKSSQLALERSVQQVSLMRTKASSAKASFSRDKQIASTHRRQRCRREKIRT